MENEKAEIKKEIKEEKQLEKAVKSLKVVSWLALGIGVIAILIGLSAFLSSPKGSASAPYTTSLTPSPSTNTTTPSSSIYVNGSLITPPMSLPDAPVIMENQSFGSRLTHINEPFNATELAVINNASNSYFEEAGMMYLNGSINGVGASPTPAPILIVNGKPTVIYLGSITCIYCGENRWAMALALGRFGNFSALFKGYSSFGDLDIPTIYWAPAEYNTSTGDPGFGNFYNSKYINFISIDYAAQIRAGFAMQSLSYFISQAQKSNSKPYLATLELINSLNNFQGTPYTIWGKFVVAGADAVDFGNVNPSQPPLPIEYMTHEQILSQLAHPNNTFAWREYAAADLYIAMTCASINNTAPVCSLPAIRQIEVKSGYAQ